MFYIVLGWLWYVPVFIDLEQKLVGYLVGGNFVIKLKY